MEKFKIKFKEVLNYIVPDRILNRDEYIDEAITTFAAELYSAAIEKQTCLKYPMVHYFLGIFKKCI